MPNETPENPLPEAQPDAVAVPATPTGPKPRGGPAPEWQSGLYKRVVNAIYALPGLFKSSLNITGVRATDLYTLNSALGASIEQSVVDNLNALRTIWDPDEALQLYAFVRQPQVFPDVRLQTSAAVERQIVMGVELKGWFALAKEGEPSFRYTVTPGACADADILVVFPWLLNEIVSGTPRLLMPFVAEARYVAEHRNHYWEILRGLTGEDAAVRMAEYQSPYPKKGDRFNDSAVKDSGGNFGNNLLDSHDDSAYTLFLGAINSKIPEGLQGAIEHFSDPQTCFDLAKDAKWGARGPECPQCGDKRLSFIKTRTMWTCLECRKQFSVKVGTIFEDSPVPLKKWFCAMWLVANCKNGISSYEIARALKVTQQTAWFMDHRIRYAMHHGTINKTTGEVEADETHIGGKARFMHKDRRDKMRGRSNFGKAVVFGLLERETGQVRTAVVPNRSKEVLQHEVHKHVRKRAHLMTDEHLAYEGLGTDYTHNVINHAESYVEGNVHTNRMENFWSLLKRSIKGTYVSVEPFHLFRYLDEQSFRYNERHSTDRERFEKVLGSISGKRLTYARVKG